MERQPYDRKYYVRYQDPISLTDADLFNIISTDLLDETDVIIYATHRMFPNHPIVLSNTENIPDKYKVGFLKNNSGKIRSSIINHRKNARDLGEYASLLRQDLQNLLQTSAEIAEPVIS